MPYKNRLNVLQKYQVNELLTEGKSYAEIVRMTGHSLGQIRRVSEQGFHPTEKESVYIRIARILTRATNRVKWRTLHGSVKDFAYRHNVLLTRDFMVLFFESFLDLERKVIFHSAHRTNFEKSNICRYIYNNGVLEAAHFFGLFVRMAKRYQQLEGEIEASVDEDRGHMKTLNSLHYYDNIYTYI